AFVKLFLSGDEGNEGLRTRAMMFSEGFIDILRVLFGDSHDFLEGVYGKVFLALSRPDVLPIRVGFDSLLSPTYIDSVRRLSPSSGPSSSKQQALPKFTKSRGSSPPHPHALQFSGIFAHQYSNVQSLLKKSL